jgi:hypothetical protein
MTVRKIIWTIMLRYKQCTSCIILIKRKIFQFSWNSVISNSDTFCCVVPLVSKQSSSTQAHHGEWREFSMEDVNGDRQFVILHTLRSWLQLLQTCNSCRLYTRQFSAFKCILIPDMHKLKQQERLNYWSGTNNGHTEVYWVRSYYFGRCLLESCFNTFSTCMITKWRNIEALA